VCRERTGRTNGVLSPQCLTGQSASAEIAVPNLRSLEARAAARRVLVSDPSLRASDRWMVSSMRYRAISLVIISLDPLHRALPPQYARAHRLSVAGVTNPM